MKTPLIFDIVRSSTVDGPGVRTTVFFKGCNLRCRWCHNPEGQDPRAQPAFFAEKCRHCGACVRFCTADECNLCGRCVDICISGARRIYGKRMTPRDIVKVVTADRLFYDATGGGVTFSGGECMLYPEFLAQCAALCKERQINVAIDTAGNVPFENFEKILPYADSFLYDIKCITPKTHKLFTGADNRLILSNFEKLLALGAKITVRVPLIEQFNDGDELRLIQSYLNGKNVKVEYLAYHAMGENKRRALTDNKFFKKVNKQA